MLFLSKKIWSSLSGHWCLGSEKGNQNSERYLHRVPGVPQDPRDLCQDDPEGKRRGGDPETGDGSVPEHVVQPMPRVLHQQARRPHLGPSH